MRFLSMSIVFLLHTTFNHVSASSTEDDLSSTLSTHSSSMSSSTQNMTQQNDTLIFSHTNDGTLLSKEIKNTPFVREIIFNNTRVGGLEHLHECQTVNKLVFAGKETLPSITFLTKEDLPPELKLLILMDNNLNEFHLLSAPSQLYVLSLENVFDAISVPPLVSVLGAIMNGDVFQGDDDWRRIASISNITVKDDNWKEDIFASSLTFQNPSDYLQNLGITENTMFDFIDGKIQIHNLMAGHTELPIIKHIQNARMALPLLPV